MTTFENNAGTNFNLTRVNATVEGDLVNYGKINFNDRTFFNAGGDYKVISTLQHENQVLLFLSY